MLTKEGSNKIVNFMNPRAGILVLGCGHVSHIVKMHYFFKNLLFSKALIRQTKYIVIMTKEGSTEIVTFMTPGVLALGRGHISKIFPIKIIFSTPTTFFYLVYPNNKDLTVGHL